MDKLSEDWADNKAAEIVEELPSDTSPYLVREYSAKIAQALREAAEKGMKAVIYGDDDLSMTPYL